METSPDYDDNRFLEYRLQKYQNAINGHCKLIICKLVGISTNQIDEESEYSLDNSTTLDEFVIQNEESDTLLFSFGFETLYHIASDDELRYVSDELIQSLS